MVALVDVTVIKQFGQNPENDLIAMTFEPHCFCTKMDNILKLYLTKSSMVLKIKMRTKLELTLN